MTARPEKIFDLFLRRVRSQAGEQSGFQIPPSKLHRIFYVAHLKHPELMDSFSFLVRTQPYSPTLARLIWEFQQANQLGRLNPDYTGYIIKYVKKYASEPTKLGDCEENLSPVIDTLMEELELSRSN